MGTSSQKNYTGEEVRRELLNLAGKIEKEKLMIAANFPDSIGAGAEKLGEKISEILRKRLKEYSRV